RRARRRRAAAGCRGAARRVRRARQPPSRRPPPGCWRAPVAAAGGRGSGRAASGGRGGSTLRLRALRSRAVAGGESHTDYTAGMTDIRITLARADDAAAIAEMSRRFVEAGLPWSWDEPRVRRCIHHSECCVIVARDRRRLAGFAIMEFYDMHAHLGLLAVQPGYRKQGVGRRLLEWLEATARTAGIF